MLEFSRLIVLGEFSSHVEASLTSTVQKFSAEDYLEVEGLLLILLAWTDQRNLMSLTSFCCSHSPSIAVSEGLGPFTFSFAVGF